MRKILSVAAFALALCAPGAARATPHFGPHGWGVGWNHGFHHGWGWGWGGVGLGLGAIAIGEASCYRERPMYDAYGEYVGSRMVDVCF